MAECLIKRIITFKEAVSYGPVRIINEQNIDITNECKYSWSVDGVCWTSWVSYDQYQDIARNIESDYFLRILVFGGLKTVYYNDILTDCYNICFDQSNVFLTEFCDNPNLFQPYTGLDCALLLQQQTADSVICMFGIPVYYLRVSPRDESIDYTFKEWTLHNVTDVKQMKLMIADGQMPSSNPRLTDFDFDWDIDWETEISKNHFARAFGDSAFPKQRDLIYVPLMKRLWEVNSAYDEKNEGLMWRPTTWKLALVKYNEKTNVDKGDFEELIDGWLVNKYDDVWGERETAEQERESGSPQLSAPRFSATNLYDIFMEDAIRKQITKNDIIIQNKMFCHHNNVTARNIYIFKNENGCINYQKSVCGDDGWLSFVVETPGGIKNLEKRDILEFGNIAVSVGGDEDSFYIEWEEMKARVEPFSTYMVILRWCKGNNTIDMKVYPYTHNTDIPPYLLKPDSYWWNFTSPIFEGVGIYNDDFSIEGGCQLFGWPLAVTNIKYYRAWMTDEDMIKESIKYTTNHEKCVINDLARPLTDGHGYAVK